ncbi:eukaryotic translation initiation factor 3 subunit D [Chytriomyces sp. MP71]|nr:eukaryotic translation initiation factor 3 subunit D [Chytriomyces sp. MP71]
MVSKNRSKSRSPQRNVPAPEPSPVALSFLLPPLSESSNGWGPPTSVEGLAAFASLNQIPYAPFSRFDRIGKVADWSAPVQQTIEEQTRGRGRGFNQNNEAVGSGTASAFAFGFNASDLLDEASFSVVDRLPVGPAAGSGMRKLTSRGGSYAQKRGGPTNVSTFSNNRFKQGSNSVRGGYGSRGGRGGYGGRYNDKVTRLRDASVAVGNDWIVKEEIEFNRLGKLYFEVDEPEDLSVHGKAYFYDKNFDRINTKSEKRLVPNAANSLTFANPSASADPILQSYASEIDGRVVAASADVIAAIMCCTKSVYGWDLLVSKDGDRVTLDKREGGYFDLYTVNENAAEPPQESETETLNTPTFLAQEATQIVQNYAAQVVKADETPFLLKQASPFAPDADAAGQPLASGLHRYRKWDLGNDISLVARTTVDCVVEAPNPEGELAESVADEILESPLRDVAQLCLATTRCLNEFDSRAPGSGGSPDWRSKIDQQRGAVMVSEIKNNGNKLARWTVESVLAGAELLKIGFAVRSNTKDRAKHAIVAGLSVKPVEFAGQMNYSLGSGWGVLRAIVDLIYGWGDGKYVMVKDPNKPILRFYSVPSDFGVVAGVVGSGAAATLVEVAVVPE